MPPEDSARRAHPSPDDSGPTRGLLDRLLRRSAQPTKARQASKPQHGTRVARLQRRKVIRLAVVAGVAAVVVGLLLAPGVRGVFFNRSGGGLPATVANQSSATSAYADTPAATFPIGATGILPPPAAKLGPFSAADVEAATKLTKQTLVAARLDPAMLEKGDTTTYLSKLAPSLRPMIGSALQNGAGALGYATRLVPGTKLASTQIRISGTMDVSLGTDQQLVIKADYVWVYPLVRSGATPSATMPGGELVVLHTVETYEWYQPAKVVATERGLRTGGGEWNAYNKDCGKFGQGYLTLGPLDKDGHTTAPPTAAYNPKTAPDLPGAC
ncbi:hypothetical protein [Fodinicola acaciae]|uniref:hypothetical protein n=1 Tax=Fodinicola acaciae TaxID=2681555 RepID=UPI0013D6C240|nr:hypothetical protein [Fodinicola acaciae]